MKGAWLGPNLPLNLDGVRSRVKDALNVGAFCLAAQQVAFCNCLPLPTPELLPSRESSVLAGEAVGEPGEEQTR